MIFGVFFVTVKSNEFVEVVVVVCVGDVSIEFSSIKLFVEVVTAVGVDSAGWMGVLESATDG